MTANHFFVPKAQLVGTGAVLRGAEQDHFRRVLRGRPGGEVWLFDEDGVRSRAGGRPPAAALAIVAHAWKW